MATDVPYCCEYQQTWKESRLHANNHHIEGGRLMTFYIALSMCRLLQKPGTAERGINDKKRNTVRATSATSRHGLLPRPNNNFIRIACTTMTVCNLSCVLQEITGQ